MNIVEDSLRLIKLKRKEAMLIFALTSVLLLSPLIMPQKIMALLFLDKIPTESGWVLSLLWIISGALTLYNLVYLLKTKALSFYKNIIERNKVKHNFSNLSDNELMILYEFKIQDKHFVALPEDVNEVRVLIDKGIVTAGTFFTCYNGKRSYSMCYLTAHAKRYMDTLIDFESLKSARPIWYQGSEQIGETQGI